MKGPLKLNGLALCETHCGSSTILCFCLAIKSACCFARGWCLHFSLWQIIQVENKVLLMVLQEPLAQNPFLHSVSTFTTHILHLAILHFICIMYMANLKQTWLNPLIKHSRQQIGMHAGGMIRSHFMGHSPIFFAQSNGILRFGYRSTCILMFFKLKGCILLVLHVH